MRKSKRDGLCIAAVILLALFVMPLADEACNAQTPSKIDWLQGYVSATGRGYAKKTGAPMDADNAVVAARVIAKKELLEAIKGVRIDSQRAVSDLMVETTETTARVQGVLHHAMQVGEPQIREEGQYVTATVEMRVCLYNEGTGCRSDQPLVSALPSAAPVKDKKGRSCDLLPNIAATREILSKVAYDTNQPLALAVVNMKGQPINPGLRDFAIGYTDGAGGNCSIYSPEKVDPVVRKDRGTAEIFIHAADAQRKYGANVVMVKALSIDPNNYICIDRKDAYLLNLLNERENQSVFRQAKIGIAAQD